MLVKKIMINTTKKLKVCMGTYLARVLAILALDATIINGNG
jgi:hypothetical protein